MSVPGNDGINRREFFSRTGRGAALAATGAAASRTVLAQADSAQPQTAGAENALKIGWSTVTITPDKPVQLHGQFHERVSEKVLDPCLAIGLAFESGDPAAPEQAIMVGCDIVNVDADTAEEVRRRVAERLPDFDARKLFINATHTHTAPTMMTGLYREPDPGVMKPAEYAEFFTNQVAEAAVQAWNARKPGAISRAVGHAAVGFCRIAKYADGSSVMYGKSDQPSFVGLEGGHDHGLELLLLWDAQQNLTGILVNLACPSQVVEGQRYLSADFWGPVREGVKALYGENVHVYPMVSAAGDQSPRDLVRRGRGEPSMREEEGMREMGRRIAEGIDYAFKHAQSQRVSAPVLKHHAEWLDLPARKVTDEEAQMARDEIAKVTKDGPPEPGSRDEGVVIRMNKLLDRYNTQGEAPIYAMDLHVIRLGDIAMATNPFELYIEYGMQIKARSRADQTFLAQLTGDRGKYLPTRQAVPGMAYGSRITENTVGPEGGDVLVERTVEVINSMWDT